MTTITKDLLQNFRVDFARAVSDLETKYGMQIKLGNIRYGDDDFHTTLTVSKPITGPLRSTNPKFVKQFKDYRFMHGFSDDVLGKDILLKGKPFTIAGFRPQARLQMVLLEKNNPNPRAFTATTVEAVKKALETPAHA